MAILDFTNFSHNRLDESKVRRRMSPWASPNIGSFSFTSPHFGCLCVSPRIRHSHSDSSARKRLPAAVLSRYLSTNYLSMWACEQGLEMGHVDFCFHSMFLSSAVYRLKGDLASYVGYHAHDSESDILPVTSSSLAPRAGFLRCPKIIIWQANVERS